MEIKEFEIKTLPGVKFRTKRVSPIELLALTMTTDVDNYEKSVILYTVVLEHLETLMGEKWIPVKVKGRDVFMPTELESNIIAIQELSDWFVLNVIDPVFQKSSE